MKSLVYVEPELPPPPYTWLIFTVVGGGGGCTVRAMLVLLLRPCASLTVMASDFGPAEVPLATAIWNEKVLSPATVSPWVPSSKNVCAAPPPIELKLPITVIPVLTG